MLKSNRQNLVILISILSLLTIINYAKAQDTLWTRRFNQSRNEQALDMAKDSSDNIIIVGVSHDSISIFDIQLLKYNQTGDLIWHRLYDTGQTDWGFCVTTDLSGNIYVGSYHIDLTTEKPGLTKFSPDGEILWSRMYPQLANCWITGVALDTQRNIYACGHSIYNPVAMIIKCDTIGNMLWRRFYNWGDVQGFADIVVDNNGEIFVTGFNGTSGLLVAKFNNNGDSIWTRYFPTTSDGRGITLDHQGNVVVAGYTTNWVTYDALIIKYSPIGNMIWNRILNYHPIDYLMKVSIDAVNNIFVSGASGTTLDTLDYLLVKLLPSGDTLWTRFYNAGYNDCGTGVVIDRLNNPIITGYSSNGSNYDVLTIKYRGSSGIEESVYNFNFSNQDYRVKFATIKTRDGNINLEINRPDKYKISLYNSIGALVQIIHQGYLYQGLHQFNLDRLQNGVYFLNIDNGKNKTSHKIIYTSR